MNSEKVSRIPNSLEDCTHTGSVVSNLYYYAQTLEKWGKRLLFVLVFIGAISTAAEVIGLIDNNEDAIIPTLIASVFSWTIYAIIEYAAYRVLAMLIRALARITENTEITANVALWQASKKADDEKAEAAKKVVTPKMENVVTGEPTTPTKTTNGAVPVVNEDGSWTCPNCKQKNLSTRTTCWRCDYQNR